MKDFINNENKELCKKCSGMCCKNSGCGFSPRDFVGKITLERLERLIKTGLVSLDWWDGDPTNETDSSLNDKYAKAYFIRIRNFALDKGADLAPIIDPSFGGICILLGKDGCKLEFKNRPLQGQALIPKSGQYECVAEYTKRDCCIEWLEYDEILNKLYDIYNCYDFIGYRLHGRNIEPSENSIEDLIKILNEE